MIPAAIADALATALRDRRETAAGRLRFHQHGAAGRARLANLLGEDVERIFTPPWNRCTQARREHPRGDGLPGVAARLPDAVDGRPAVGVMLHHAELDAQERGSLRELIRFLSGHPKARLAGMAAAHRRVAAVGSGP